ncbi:MAG: thioredoxin [Saprospirales bacterium]|nr:MAG: thioredoxin [Saprospirales bacterium]
MSIQELAELSLKKAVLIDFWAEWCGPCKTFGPILDKVAAKFTNGLHLEKIDVEENQDLAAQFRVQSIPTIVLLSEGKISGVSQGALSEAELEKWLIKHLPDLQADNQDSDWRKYLEALPPVPDERRSDQLEQWLRVNPEDKDLQLEYLRAVSFSQPEDGVAFLNEFEAANENHWLVPYFRNLLDELISNKCEAVTDDKSLVVKLIKDKDLNRLAQTFTEFAADGSINANDDLKKLAVAFFTCLGDGHPVSKKYRKLFNMYLS